MISATAKAWAINTQMVSVTPSLARAEGLVSELSDGILLK